MWPYLVSMAFTGIWMGVVLINQGHYTNLKTAQAEFQAGKVLAQHDCQLMPPCKGGYSEADNKNFIRSERLKDYVLTYGMSAYREGDAYLPILVGAAKHSQACVGRWKKGAFVQEIGAAAPACQTVPATLLVDLSARALAEGAVVLYQKLQ